MAWKVLKHWRSVHHYIKKLTNVAVLKVVLGCQIMTLPRHVNRE